MKIFSTFSGIGGFEVGIQNAVTELLKTKRDSPTVYDKPDNTGKLPQEGRLSATCVGYSEIDKFAIKVYERHFRQDKTAEDLQSDLDCIKTIFENKNYSIMEVCYVNTAGLEQTSIRTTSQSVKTALENFSSSGGKTIKKLISVTNESLELCLDKKCSICMGMSVPAAGSVSTSSLPLSTEMETGISTGKSTGLAICINSPSKFTNQKNMKFCATTVITLKGGTAYAHISRTKPIRNFGDITKINAEELPDFDCLVGGFPCQAFSIAGKRKGFEDTRGTLFFDLARILRAKQPRLFVFENVKGLLSHDSGRTFKTIIQTIDELGYDCQWQVLNSKNFGVPQNRERIIIVGHLRGTPRPEVFPISQNDRTDIVLPTLTARYYGGQANGGYISNKQTQVNKPDGSIGGQEQAKSDFNIVSGRTQTTPRVRRLTPIECERLQAFPDNWTKYGKNGDLISDTQRYKMCGNAVTTNVIQAVFERILK